MTNPNEPDDYIDPMGERHDLKVEVQAPFVAQPAALTSTSPSASYVQAEMTALRTDVSNLRTTVANLLTALKQSGNNGPMATS